MKSNITTCDPEQLCQARLEEQESRDDPHDTEDARRPRPDEFTGNGRYIFLRDCDGLKKSFAGSQRFSKPGSPL
jgi:hypothetical protein